MVGTVGEREWAEKGENNERREKRSRRIVKE